MTPDRFATLPGDVPLVALTTTARGMVDHTLTRAARQAFGELMQAVGRAGLMPQVRSCISLCPDEPQGPDDPHCRYVAGVLFGHDLATQQGVCTQPAVPLAGSLAWQTLDGGRCAVFTHRGPYDTLHHSWDAIYRDWLPTSGETLRDAPPLELCINTPDTASPADLVTEIWIPVV